MLALPIAAPSLIRTRERLPQEQSLIPLTPFTEWTPPLSILAILSLIRRVDVLGQAAIITVSPIATLGLLSPSTLQSEQVLFITSIVTRKQTNPPPLNVYPSTLTTVASLYLPW